MHITAQKVSASELVVIDTLFHKLLNTHKGFLTKKGTLEIPVCLYPCTYIGSITYAFSLKIFWERSGENHKASGGCRYGSQLLITDKRIMAERSSVPSQVSKRSTTSDFSSKILVQKRQGKLWWFKDKSEVSEPNSPFSLLRCNWKDPKKILKNKISPKKHDQLNTFI